MKPVIAKEDVAKAISQLIAAGKKPTLAALHATLNNKGSMSTLVRLKAELEAESSRPAHPPEALEAFLKIWSAAHVEGSKTQEQINTELREHITALAVENERLDSMIVALHADALTLLKAKALAEAQLNEARINTDRELSGATAAVREAGEQSTRALQELAEARRIHATEVTNLRSQLEVATRDVHSHELELVRLRTLLDSQDALTPQHHQGRSVTPVLKA